MRGAGGNDTYIFNLGDGEDIIQDYRYDRGYYNGGTNDTLIFDTGITLDDLSWSFDDLDLVFSFANSPNDQVTIESYSHINQRIETILVEGN